MTRLSKKDWPKLLSRKDWGNHLEAELFAWGFRSGEIIVSYITVNGWGLSFSNWVVPGTLNTND